MGRLAVPPRENRQLLRELAFAQNLHRQLEVRDQSLVFQGHRIHRRAVVEQFVDLLQIDDVIAVLEVLIAEPAFREAFEDRRLAAFIAALDVSAGTGTRTFVTTAGCFTVTARFTTTLALGRLGSRSTLHCFMNHHGRILSANAGINDPDSHLHNGGMGVSPMYFFIKRQSMGETSMQQM